MGVSYKEYKLSFQEKLKKAHKEMDEAGIKRSNYNSAILVLLRKLGLNIKPFQYYSFLQSFIITSAWFATAWGLLMWFTTWQFSSTPVLIALSTSVFAGLLFGLIMALYFKRSAKKNNLSSWEKL